VTSDRDRALVLKQNAELGAAFAHLRRCFVCLCTPCPDASSCRRERRAWARKQWDNAIAMETQSGDRQTPVEFDSGP
jgi:hypothetical protein